MRSALTGLVTMVLIAAPAMAQQPEDGRVLYEKHCAQCHGEQADGQGPLAGALMLKPADLTRLSAENGGSFPLRQVLRRVDGTDPLVSHGSPMPVFGPYFEGVANTPMKLATGQPVLAPQPMADLISYLLTIQVN